MKVLVILSVLMTISSAFAACLDVRVKAIPACDGDEKRMYVQGACSKSFQFESTYCAVEGNPECSDARVAHFGSCSSGESRIFIQGQCERKYLVEHTYCAKR